MCLKIPPVDICKIGWRSAFAPNTQICQPCKDHATHFPHEYTVGTACTCHFLSCSRRHFLCSGVDTRITQYEARPLDYVALVLSRSKSVISMKMGWWFEVHTWCPWRPSDKFSHELRLHTRGLSNQATTTFKIAVERQKEAAITCQGDQALPEYTRCVQSKTE